MAATGAETCEGGYMQIIARKVGTDEAALRFLISMFAGYPLAIFLRDNLHDTSATTKHLFISAVGLAISYFNYGMDTKYLLFCSLVNYIVLTLAGGTGASVIFSFVFNVGYLLVSYAIYASNDYDMNWTTPQCILTLRMISVAYDLYDGHTPVEKLSPEQKSLCFKEPPGPLEMVSYSFFFGYLLTGPQCPLRQYRDYMDGNLLDNESGKPSDTLQPAMKILGIGMIYFLVEILIVPSFTASYLLTEEFAQSSFLYKLFYISLFGRFTINKYVTFWLISEGVCILSGIAYTGKDKAGKAKFTSCSGIKPLAFETALSVRDMVATFNISTNTWLARYVYKRLKFLGNRYVSQIVSLMFLAAWHGLHIGYYNNFILEFFIVMFDVQATELFTKVPVLNKLSQHRLLALVKLLVLKFLMLLFMGYPLVSFVLLRWSKIHAVYKEVYYIGHIFFLLLWPILSFGVIMPRFKAHRRKSKEQEDAKTK
ncbi:lysophospholipid acyltransferase 5 isoform X2 [Strongylocentrotus purpuratus]|uniref:Lysophospholipid acyltransferase 5 n=1 Tax=Strongylocentrotus purpuratus TaxID=7668 RepID=A0A7M7NXH3_STRPU|nr:lysophospholipid acyltransferase 5 isoform X2 [Strongylocentrotus purpuratus]